MVAGLVIALVGAVGWLLYRHARKQSRAEEEFLRFPWQPHYDIAQIREKIAAELDRIANDKEGGTINPTS